MKKKEWVYRLLLYRHMEKKERRQTQLSLSESLGISLSTVNNALRPLAKIGAVEIESRGLRISDAEKALAYWSSMRNLERDIVYSTRANAAVSEVEKSMPPGAIYTAYTAYKFLFGEAPADYSEVYVYADWEALEGIKARFPAAGGPANLVVLESDAALAKLCGKGVAPAQQVYADLWNLKEWYAREFVKALEGRFGW